MDKESAVVVKIKGRYFCEFGKLGQVKTAWAIVGAKLFFPGSADLGKVVKALTEKGKKFEVMVLAVVA